MNKWINNLSITIFFSLLLAGCSKQSLSEEPEPDPLEPPTFSMSTLLTDRGIIWGFDFLPDGNLIFTQKTGFIGIYDTTTRSVQSITGGPGNLAANGQGGMLDIAVHPQYNTTGHIYLTYSSTGGFLNLVRFTLNGLAITNWQVLKTTSAASTWAGHYGSRIAFKPDGKMYWSVGEGGSGSMGGPTSTHRNAQLLTNEWGKIHRMNADGSIPADNPLFGGATSPSSFYSIGHRNPQGLAFNPKSGDLWSTEHGPQGGCELNKIAAGANYGWPNYSTGINYNGSAISGGQHGAGTTGPLKTWSPALAPSGTTFINSTAFKAWNGNLLIGSLARRHLLMIDMENGVPGKETVLLNNIGRVRNVRQAPNGTVYVSVEDGGRLLQLVAN